MPTLHRECYRTLILVYFSHIVNNLLMVDQACDEDEMDEVVKYNRFSQHIRTLIFLFEIGGVAKKQKLLISSALDVTD